MKKPPLLLLHGALGSQQQFSSLLPALSLRFQVYHFDFSGHGGKEIAGPFGLERFANEVLHHLDTLQLTQAHLFGYSMGGYVALYLARYFPERVNRIVTLATKFDWTPESAAKEQKMLVPEVIEAKVPHFAAALAHRHAPQDWKRVMQETADMMHRLGNGEALGHTDFLQIDAPTLLLRATGDKMVSEQETQTVAQDLPLGTFQPLSEGKHPIETVPLAPLVAAIQNFLIA